MISQRARLVDCKREDGDLVINCRIETRMRTDELLANYGAWLDGVLSEPANSRSVTVLAFISEQAALASKLLATKVAQAELEQQMKEITQPLPLIPTVTDELSGSEIPDGKS